MAPGTATETEVAGAGPARLAMRWMRQAQYSAAAALVTELALILLFLWAMNPGNLVAAASVLVRSNVLIAPIAGAMLLPVLTVVWVGWLLQQLRTGGWAAVRRVLPAVMVLGYFSLIAPGYFLHETLHLIDSPRWPRAPSARPTPAD